MSDVSLWSIIVGIVMERDRPLHDPEYPLFTCFFHVHQSCGWIGEGSKLNHKSYFVTLKYWNILSSMLISQYGKNTGHPCITIFKACFQHLSYSDFKGLLLTCNKYANSLWNLSLWLLRVGATQSGLIEFNVDHYYHYGRNLIHNTTD